MPGAHAASRTSAFRIAAVADAPTPPTAVPVVRRYTLPLGPATIGVLKGAAERALNVPAARSARATSGRAAAAAALVGRRTRAVKLRTNACRVVVERPVDLTPRQRGGGLVKKKKRSGRVRRFSRVSTA